MPDYSIVDTAFQLGAVLSRAVDMSTGELLPITRRPAGDEDTARGVGGLSNPHNCTHEGKSQFWLEAGLVKCAKPTTNNSQVGGGPRGKITKFTAGSKRRLMYKLGQVQRAKLPVMITLTYPGEYTQKSAVWKSHLRRFYQRMKRRYKDVAFIWKLEPQQRGAPHYHLLAWGLDKIPLYTLKGWVSKAWYQVVGSGDIKHLIAGTRVETVRNRRGVMAYASKYLGKVMENIDWDQPGRFWGVKGSENMPWGTLVECAITYRQAVKLLRLMRRYMKCKRTNLPGLTMLCDNPDYWFDHLHSLVT